MAKKTRVELPMIATIRRSDDGMKWDIHVHAGKGSFYHDTVFRSTPVDRLAPREVSGAIRRLVDEHLW